MVTMSCHILYGRATPLGFPPLRPFELTRCCGAPTADGYDMTQDHMVAVA